jgi:hypothetical protein
MTRRSAGCAAAALLACASWSPAARALDAGKVGGDKVEIDVTETSIFAQHFNPLFLAMQEYPHNLYLRFAERPEDSGWGDWINRLNVALHWGHFTAGARLDSAVYSLPPINNGDYQVSASELKSLDRDSESRYQNSIYPAKLWLTYKTPDIEVTVGDAYVQFGKGLTLSMRKIDELGIDTTLRGVKVTVQKDPFAVTAVAGFGNPTRVDEASGRALFPTIPVVDPRIGLMDTQVPMFGSDRIAGVDVQAGRGLPVTLSTHAVQVDRCAPYHYDAQGLIVTDPLKDPLNVTFGTCGDSDTGIWLNSLGSSPPSIDSRTITMVGQSLEVPSLGGHGKLYIEAAGQQRRQFDPRQSQNGTGNAIYASLAFDVGKTNTTLEIKSNRNFYQVPASVLSSTPGGPEFNVVGYSFAPPTETLNQLDTQFGNFNACVDGGRLREDVNVTPSILAYAQGVYAFTKGEQYAGCDAQGHVLTSVADPNSVEDRVYDGLLGFEWTFDKELSHVYGSIGVREDNLVSGPSYYEERHLEYSVQKHVKGPWSVEVAGRHRLRREAHTNDDASGTEQFWAEGENYVALKLAPKWVFTQGFEYTTEAVGQTYGTMVPYFNGSVLYKFTSSSNVRLFVGQQRGAFRCASGVCRYFPPFEGARAELTLRF